MMEQVNMENEMIKSLDDIKDIYIFNNGKGFCYKKDSQEYTKIVKNLKKVYGDAVLMPAFGVSLHNETMAAMNDGLWLKIEYNKKQEIGGLPFTSLVIYLEKEPVWGFNIIREYNGELDGRCLYLNLDTEIVLTDILNEITLN